MTALHEPDAASHAVLFAESEDELAQVAGGALARCLAAGGWVIVLATDDHHRLFEARLRAEGVDPDRARHDGSLVALDAEQTLARITTAGALDLSAFDHVVGDLVRSASGRGPVLAFGELVGLLWDQGRVQEAIDLEEGWNALLHETGASLVCAYPNMQVDDATAHEVTAVCSLHSAALSGGAFEREWHFPGELAMVSKARHLVVTALRARGLRGATLDDTTLTIAELVANAVVHGRSDFSVTVHLDSDRVRVEVADESNDSPVLGAVDGDATSGRGLHLLDSLVDRWGVTRAGRGKVVWTELAR